MRLGPGYVLVMSSIAPLAVGELQLVSLCVCPCRELDDPVESRVEKVRHEEPEEPSSDVGPLSTASDRKHLKWTFP